MLAVAVGRQGHPRRMGTSLVRMSHSLLICQEADLHMGSFAVKVSEPTRMSTSQSISRTQHTQHKDAQTNHWVCSAQQKQIVGSVQVLHHQVFTNFGPPSPSLNHQDHHRS